MLSENSSGVLCHRGVVAAIPRYQVVARPRMCRIGSKEDSRLCWNLFWSTTVVYRLLVVVLFESQAWGSLIKVVSKYMLHQPSSMQCWGIDSTRKRERTTITRMTCKSLVQCNAILRGREKQQATSQIQILTQINKSRTNLSFIGEYVLASKKRPIFHLWITCVASKIIEWTSNKVMQIPAP